MVDGTYKGTKQVMPPNIEGVALCFEGGGYRASYTAGMANAILDHELFFPFVCGISAGASHTVDYVSQDRQRVRDSFIKLTTKRPEAGGPVSLLTGHGYFNADYVYVGCTEDGTMPFDFAAFRANPAEVRISSFDAATGHTVTWGKADMRTPREMMMKVRASSSLPVIMKPQTVIDGRLMYDGGLGAGAGIPVFMAEEAGYERLVFVASRPAGYRKEPPTAGERRIYRYVSKGNDRVYQALLTRGERYNEALDHVEALEREGRAFVWRPEVMPVKTTTIDTPRLVESYRMGREQAERDIPRLLEWLARA